nr:RNA-directed DNA polymerase, eukaryota [Tanacetum cinerariifolium]
MTNLCDHVTTRDLWKVCNDYGVVVDFFIPYKKSKVGKRFAFVRFIKVDNIDRLVANLCTIWIGRFNLHANVARYHKEHKLSAPSHTSNANERNSPGPYVFILKSGKTNNAMSNQVLPSLILDDSCIFDRDFSLSLMGKVKDITAMLNRYVILKKEGFQNLSLTYLGGLWVLIETVSISAKEKVFNLTGVGSWFSSLKPACNLKVWTRNTFAKVASKWDDLVEWEDLAEKSLFYKRLCVKIKLNEIIVERFKVIVKEDAEDDGSQSGDKVTSDNDVEMNKRKDSGDDLKYLLGFTPSEINVEEVNKKVKGATSNEGNSSFDYALSSSLGNSRGILCVWEPTLFVKDNVTSSDNFLAVMERWDGDCVIMRDFNEVRTEQKRYGSAFNVQGGSNEEILSDRSLLLKELSDINFIDSEAAQKSKVRWAIEVDENTKFFYGILNGKRSQLAILGILVDGEWIVDSLAMKSEIKSAVWDYGTNKSPGLDGFTFEFFRRYWKLLEHDIVAAVQEFFASGTFPPGCNFSFIALIPKIHDEKVIKDYHPISLIGSLYKIIAKTLDNRLSSVITGLISDVQSAFVSHRQILDDLFLLNELLSLCKHKKFKAMVFRVDFEKAFDSIRSEINFHKSKLMGIDTHPEEVDAAATTMGCLTFTTPFVHLGVKIGEDLALYENESWNDLRDFVKLVKAISLPQDVLCTSGRRLIELKNQVQRLMEAHLAPKSSVQVNKIASSCKICSGPHNTQCCMENPEHAFVDYASSRNNEVGGKQFTTNQGPRNFNEATNAWKDKPDLNKARTQTFTSPQNGSFSTCSSSYQTRLERVLSNFDSRQEKILSTLGTQLKLQQEDVINKINTLCKIVSERFDNIPAHNTARGSMARMNALSTDHLEKEAPRSKGIKSSSKLLSPKYQSQSSLEEQNRNPSSKKRVHFINSIVLLRKKDEPKEEETMEPNAAKEMIIA